MGKLKSLTGGAWPRQFSHRRAGRHAPRTSVWVGKWSGALPFRGNFTRAADAALACIPTLYAQLFEVMNVSGGNWTVQTTEF